MTERIDKFQPELFLDGPVEFLVKKVASEIANVEEFADIFSEFIDPYRRMDYPTRALPALRIYNEHSLKEFESWFIVGDLKLDVIFPPSIRRNETQQLQDTIAAALLQQFRRPTFFNTVGEGVPGLNELGKKFDVDKSLGFDWEKEIVPLTQITLNFRLDLRIWDDYLENSLRTKDDPFNKTLGALKRIVTTIQGMRDNNETVDVTVPLDQQTT